MRKSTLLLTIILITSFTSFAQMKVSVGVGPTIAFPVGSFKDVNNTGFGGVGQATLSINDNFDAYLSLGVTSYKGAPYKNTAISFSNLLNLDSKIGARYITKGFHMGGAIGRSAVFYTYSGTSGSISGIGLSPEIGYKKSIFDLSLSFNLNLTEYKVIDNSYNTVFESNTLNYVGLKLLVNFYEKSFK